MSHLCPLDLLQEGEWGRIVDLAGPEAWQHRLRELGLTNGTWLRLIKQGEPCLLAVREQRISIRLDHHCMIYVEVGSSPQNGEMTAILPEQLESE